MNQSELTRRINDALEKAGQDPVATSTVHRWLGGSAPNGDMIPAILAAIGGDVMRALPGYEPVDKLATVEELLREIREQQAEYGHQTGWLGRISAGTGRIGELVGVEGDERPVMDRVARAHPHYRFGDGPVFAVEVDGVSMEPDYPDGSIVLVRKVADPSSLPDKVDVIFTEAREPHSMTMKRLRLAKNRRQMIAEPLNRSMEPEILDVGDAQITHVVCGVLKA